MRGSAGPFVFFCYRLDAVKKRLLIAGGLLAALVVAAVAYLSVDRCGAWPHKAPALTQVAQSQGELKVGAAKVALQVPFPTTVGGYGPPRASVTRALTPLAARALVIELGGQRMAVVLLDALLVPPQLRDAIGEGQKWPTWVVATHTHTGPSGYDPRLASELAALGSFSPDAQQVLVTAARQALEEAHAHVLPARLELGEVRSQGVSVARSGPDVDRRVTKLRFDAASGPVAQVLILSAHPTLAARKPEGLHADWPGLLAERLERDQGPVTLVLQGAGGNASIDRQLLPTPEAVAEKLEALVRALPTAPQAEPLSGAWNEVRVSLPRPDASRLVPSLLAAAAENALCDDAEDVVVLHGLRLGEARLLWVPVEPSLPAGLVLEEQARVTRLVSLADGYAGYVETTEAARAGTGEAHRQYFPPALLGELASGAKLVGDALQEPAR